jgi:isoamylase
MLLVYNVHFERGEFMLPSVAEGIDWKTLIDTNRPDGEPQKAFPFKTSFTVTGRSRVAFSLVT